jgi:hypothetical protein
MPAFRKTKKKHKSILKIPGKSSRKDFQEKFKYKRSAKTVLQVSKSNKFDKFDKFHKFDKFDKFGTPVWASGRWGIVDSLNEQTPGSDRMISHSTPSCQGQNQKNSEKF